LPGKSISVKSSLSKSYTKLLALLRREIARGQERINTYIDFEKVRTNWNVGRHVNVHLAGEKRAPDGLYDRLGEDLNVSTRYMQDAVRFYRMYPKLPVNRGMGWGHYQVLLRLGDSTKRKQMEDRILREKLSVNDLRAIVRKPRIDPADNAVKGDHLNAERGRLYTYRIMKVTSIQNQDSFMTIDCGFDISFYQALDPATVYAGGDICESVKKEETYKIFRPRHSTANDLYIYQAMIERFIDGDTLSVNVDVGFGIWTHQKLRLRGLDCPELGTQDGLRAKTFVESELKDCPFVIIKTHKSDKYDRYLVDVFYLPKEQDPAVVVAQGKYLNQELLDRGLAKVWVS
jgi:endonuclease YncB( thermonuclease family)